MQVFRSFDPWQGVNENGDDNTEYPSKHNQARHRWQRRYFSDSGPLNSEPSAKPGTAPGIIRLDHLSQPPRLQSLTPVGSSKSFQTPMSRNQSAGNLSATLPAPYSAEKAQAQEGGNPFSNDYQGTLRYKGGAVKYLKYDTDKWSRPGYWPNCHQRSERWDNYRLHQWEDNRYDSCKPNRRFQALNKINKSNRSPFQQTPYAEQSPTMLFYQQKLAMSRSMPALRTGTSRPFTNQEERIFNFAQTQERLVTKPAPLGYPEDGEQGDPEEDEYVNEPNGETQHQQEAMVVG